MSFFDKLLGKGPKYDNWTPTHRGIVYDISYDNVTSLLGKPKKAKGGFVYWRGPMTDIDEDLPEEDLPEEDLFQISNRDYRIKGDSARPKTDRSNWFVVANSPRAIRVLANELNGLAKNIEPVPDEA